MGLAGLTIFLLCGHLEGWGQEVARPINRSVRPEANLDPATRPGQRNLTDPDPAVERAAEADSSSPAETTSTEMLGEGETRIFEATAYALKGVTRNGVYVRRGVIAADPRILPLGSIVQVTSDQYSGVYRVQDTGGLIKGEIIDLWVPTSREARQFGRRKVQVQVLKLGKRRVRP
jgi:3D (Asp-Asp-Asp) domain-containing protein